MPTDPDLADLLEPDPPFDAKAEIAKIRAPKGSKPARPLWKHVLIFSGKALAIFLIGSVAWMALYGLMPAPGTLLMVQRAIEGEKVRREFVPLSEISPHLVRAVIGAEDSRFCTHAGVDFEELENALEAAENGKKLRGASTISQQTAKNLFLWPGRNFVRKGLELYFTAGTEVMWPKWKIMESYLNAAEWGDGLFGAEAAARARFGKSAKDLTRREAALLASVLPSPNKWRVKPPGRYVARRASIIERRMRIVRRDQLDGCVFDYPTPVKRAPNKHKKQD